ncbi:MAG TPA: DUF4129 domain-containing protein [Anaeromyxobacteraceae bacterium]|nr:DUF4129 domain-containing protein [Anaeromyxobacteraceae bacterium]
MIPLLAVPLAVALGAAPPSCAPSPADGALGGWCAALSARPRLPLPSPADRDALLAVFDRPELRRARADTGALRRWLAALWAGLLELLGSAEAERYASVGRIAFVGAGVAALFGALAALRRRRGAGAPEEAPAPPPVAGRLLAPDSSAELADAALARGDLSAAVRHAFLSALAALEGAGRLPRDRALTNAELSSRLPAGDGDAGDFAALARDFDGAVYGGRPLDEPRVRERIAAARRIRLAHGGAR